MAKQDILDFNDTKTAFARLSDAQLCRARNLFRLMGFGPVAAWGPQLATWALKMRLPVRRLIEETIFRQFCGGESVEQCQSCILDLGAHGIGTILDFASEGAETQEAFARTYSETLLNIETAKNHQHIPFCAFKPSGIAGVTLMEKASRKAPLSASERQQLDASNERFRALCLKAASSKVKLFIDAEESWVQPYIDDVTETMMRACNREDAYIFATVQMYRRDRLKYLKALIERAREGGFKVGIKLVRGAYLEKEALRATSLGISLPIFSTKAETDLAFDEAVNLIHTNRDLCSLCLGTHNENSTKKLATLMKSHQVDRHDPRYSFAQLLGMGDHLSFNLAAAGYNAAKYVPYGKLEEVIPYLTRRAQENSSVKGQTGRELELLEKEVKRRKI